MQFEDMSPLQRRLHNAAIVIECEVDEYGYAGLLREAIDALSGLPAEQDGMTGNVFSDLPVGTEVYSTLAGSNPPKP